MHANTHICFKLSVMNCFTFTVVSICDLFVDGATFELPVQIIITK
jgi:hypothetical protein